MPMGGLKVPLFSRTVRKSSAPFCAYYSASSCGCFRSILEQRLNVNRPFLMNFKPVLCWEAAWYSICHNSPSHTHMHAHLRRQKGNKCVFF